VGWNNGAIMDAKALLCKEAVGAAEGCSSNWVSETIWLLVGAKDGLQTGPNQARAVGEAVGRLEGAGHIVTLLMISRCSRRGSNTMSGGEWRSLLVEAITASGVDDCPLELIGTVILYFQKCSVFFAFRHRVMIRLYHVSGDKTLFSLDH
jgi:hypothetical protein